MTLQHCSVGNSAIAGTGTYKSGIEKCWQTLQGLENAKHGNGGTACDRLAKFTGISPYPRSGTRSCMLHCHVFCQQPFYEGTGVVHYYFA